MRNHILGGLLALLVLGCTQEAPKGRQEPLPFGQVDVEPLVAVKDSEGRDPGDNPEEEHAPATKPIADMKRVVVDEQVQTNRADSYTSICRSADRRFVYLQKDEEIEVRTAKTGKKLKTLTGPEGGWVLESLNNRMDRGVFRSGRGVLLLWDVDGQKKLFEADRSGWVARWSAKNEVIWPLPNGAIQVIDASGPNVTVKLVTFLTEKDAQLLKDGKLPSMAVFPDGAKAVVALPAEKKGDRWLAKLLIVDVEKEKVIYTHEFEREENVVVSPAGAYCVIPCYDDKVLILDAKDFHVTTLTEMPNSHAPVVSWNPSNGQMYLAYNGELVIADPKADFKVVKRLKVGGHFNAGFGGATFDDEGAYAFVCEPYGGRIQVIDARSLEIATTLKSPPCWKVEVSRGCGFLAEFLTNLPYER